MNKEIVYSVVIDIERHKVQMRKMPCYALFVADILPALHEYSQEDIKSALNELVEEKRLKFGRTANDIHFATQTGNK